MKNYKKRLLLISIPMILSNLITQFQMLIDRIFLGRIDVTYMTAVGNSSTPMWTSMSFIFALSVGSSILISQSIGEKNKEKVEMYASSLLKYSHILPILLFFFWFFCSQYVYKLLGVAPDVMELCVTYTRFYAPTFLTIGIGASFIVILQTSNYTKHLATYGLIRSILNVILDYCLIFGKFGFPEMGISGAALATTLAEYGGLLFGLVLFVKSKKITTRPRLSSILSAKLMPYLKSMKLGINAALEEFLWNCGNLGLIRILNSIDKNAAGIYTLVFSFEVIIVVIFVSLGSGAMTLSGEATGAKNGIMFRRVVKTAYFWSACVVSLTVIAAIIFPKELIGIFTTDSSIIETSSIFLLLISLNMYAKSANVIVGNGIKGYGDTRWMFCSQIFGTIFVLALASFFVYGLKLGMLGVYLAVIGDEIVRSIINSIRFLKIRFFDRNYGKLIKK